MVEIQVAVEDPVRLKGLLASLTGLLDGSSLAFDDDRNELSVSTAWEPCDVDGSRVPADSPRRAVTDARPMFTHAT